MSDFAEFKQVIDQLDDQARRDVLDIATFHVWNQTRKPAPWRRVLRGAVLHLAFKIEKLTERGKRKA